MRVEGTRVDKGLWAGNAVFNRCDDAVSALSFLYVGGCGNDDGDSGGEGKSMIRNAGDEG